MLTLPGTRVYVEKISYIWVEIRAAQTLSSNHQQELPHAGTAQVGEQLRTVDYVPRTE